MKRLTIFAGLALVIGSSALAMAVVSVSVSPSAAQVAPGAQLQFTATVSGTGVGFVSWSITGAGCSGITCGQITGTGLYTAPATAPSPATVTVRATSFADATKSGTATVTIQTASAITVSVSPNAANIAVGGQQQFSATVVGTANTAVNWTVSGVGCVAASCGTITNAGLYTAPGSVPTPATVTVKATSAADASKSGSASVVIQLASAISVNVTPSTAQVAGGGSAHFSATVTGTTNTAVIWSVSGVGCSGAACGTISAGGLYTAPTTVPSPPSVIVKATSVAAPSQSDTATVSLTSAPTITVTPSSAQVSPGAKKQFTAAVTGTSSPLVIWSLSGSGCSGITCGSITGTGLYTAPASAPNPPIVAVTATLVSDPTRSASATVTISTGAPVSVSISPTSAQLSTGGQRQFTATVTGASNNAVTWQVSGIGCSGNTCGTITSAGLYTAPASIPTPPFVTVTVTSQADPTKSASATVTIAAVIAVAVAPKTAQVAPGAKRQFTATVTGSANTTVTWTVSGTGCAGAGCGTITAAGLYTAPSSVPTPPTVTIKATAQADSTKSDTATVSVVNPVIVTVSPASAVLTVGSQQEFKATVTGIANTAVNWSVSGAGCAGAACGTVTSGGLYTAPAAVPSPATVKVTATSQADATKSGAATVTVTPTNNSKLNGQYAFLFKGFDATGANQVAGTFKADGNGHVTAGVQDINRSAGPATNVAFTGTYQVGADNRGTMTITSAQGNATYAFALNVSAKSGRLIRFDNSGVRGSGVLRLQSPSSFDASALDGGYALSLSGLDWLGGRIAAVGAIFPSGSGFISGSGLDVNDNGGVFPTFTGFNGTYTVAANGRGTATLNILGFGNGVFHFAFYVVSAKELLLVSTDRISPGNPIFGGLAEQQSGSPFFLSSFSGFSVFNLTGFDGSSVSASIGRMSFDGKGVLAAQSDDNKGGNIVIANMFTGNYTVAPNGRGILNLLNSQTHLVTPWIFYAIAPNRAFLLDTSGIAAGTGEMKGQSVSPPFTSANIEGNYLLGSGEATVFDLPLVSGVGNFDGGQNIDGTQDQTQGSTLFPSQDLAGTYAVSLVSRNGRGTILLTSPGTSTFALWLVSGSEFVALQVDASAVEPTVTFFEQ
jgi:hypothetical protein